MPIGLSVVKVENARSAFRGPGDNRHIGDGDVRAVACCKAHHLLALHDRYRRRSSARGGADWWQAAEAAEVHRGLRMTGAQSTPPSRDQRKDVPGPGKVGSAGIGIGQRPAARARSSAEMPVPPSGLVDRHRERGGVVGSHGLGSSRRRRVFRGDRRADDAQVWRMMRPSSRRCRAGCDDQIASPSGRVISDDDEFALGKGTRLPEPYRPFPQHLPLLPGWISRTRGSAPAPDAGRYATRGDLRTMFHVGSRPQDKRSGSGADVQPYGKNSLRSASWVSISARLSSSRPASAASITEYSSPASVSRVTVT